MKKALIAFALLAAAVSGRAQDPATSAANGPSLSFELRPAQASYWAGQRALAVVTLAPGELDVLAEPAIEIFPEDAPGVERGRFSQLAAPAGSLRWAQPVRFAEAATFRAEPRLAAEFGRVERRGIMTIQQGLGRRLVSAPGRTVVVKPLPAEGRPADFSGLVGAYSLSGSLDTDACAPGDIVNLRWELRGPGAEDLAEPPSVAPGREFKVYPPRVEAREEGRLAVSQALVPVSTNAAAVAALPLSVFDPAAGAYRTLAAGPFPLRVAEKPPEPDPAADGADPAAAEAPGDPAADLPARAPGTSFVPGEPVHARFAPADSARELFVLGAGEAAVVRELSPDGAWVRILRRADGATGWIPASRARTELY